MAGGPIEEGSCRWRYKKKAGGLGSKDFCPSCKSQDDLSATHLRRMITAGDLILNGSCTQNDTSGPTGGGTATTATRGRTRTRTERHEASATGKMNTERSKSSKSRRSKRRKSVQDARFAASILKKELIKQQQGKEPKPSLVRGTVAFISGKENVHIKRNKAESCAIGSLPSEKVTTPKSTKYRQLKTGAEVINGAAKILSCHNPIAFKAGAYEASLKMKLDQPSVLLDGNTSSTATAKENITEEKNQERTRLRMCDTFIELMKQLDDRPEARRPYLACFAASKRPDVEKLCNIKLSKYEWTRAKIHALYPGPLKPAPKVETLRQRIKTATLNQFMEFMERPGILQRYAFGTKILGVTRGKGIREIESIDTLKKVQKIAVDFILALDSEISAADSQEEDLPADTMRCCQLERDTQCRCMHLCNHSTRCKFTPKGSMSRTTAIKLIKTLLTGGEVKKLAGLDDAKVVKGRENFEAMRELATELVDDLGERRDVMEAINQSELYYQTDFVDHLARNSTQNCNCLSCGFSTADEILCNNKDHHNPSCVECANAFSVIRTLDDKLSQKRAAAMEFGTTSTSKIIQELEQRRFEILETRNNLTEYRSHLARHKAEGDFDNEETLNLDDQTAIVISDWKMKILARFYRKNQARWFGKRGTSCLGFMIISNSTDPVVREKRLKEVQFIMMFTDDTKQDDHAVSCAKAEVYREHLPAHVDKVIFRADGASCFKSAYHRGITTHWATWTGIEEIVYRITPAGDGKSALDGMFGRLNSILSSAVDEGHSYQDSASTLHAAEESGGLSATKFLTFKPDRHTRLFAGFDESTVKWGDILRTELNVNTRQITAYAHSGYGKGAVINPSQAHFSTKALPTAKSIKQRKDLLLPDLQYDHRKFKALIARNLRQWGETTTDELFGWKIDLAVGEIEAAHFYSIAVPSLENLAPQCLYVVAGSNAKEEFTSYQAEPGVSSNHPHQRHNRKQGRVMKKAASIVDEETRVRAQKTASKIFLCPARCPVSLHYCRHEFLKELNMNKHIAAGKHAFPQGFSASDIVVNNACTAGGLMAVGSHRDRKKVHGASLKEFESSVPCGAADDANCFDKFHRKKDAKAYQKPWKLQLFLDQLFNRQPKLSPEQAWRIMKDKIDPEDGGLMFCYSKRGQFMAKSDPGYSEWPGCSVCKAEKTCNCNGMLLTKDQINSAFSSRAKKARKSDTEESEDYSAARGRIDGEA